MIGRVAVITLVGLAIGCVVAVAAVGFVDGMLWLNDRLLISPRSRMLAGDLPWLTAATIAVPALGGLAVGLLCRMIPGGRPHGPADAIRAAQSPGAVMPVKGGVITAVAAFLSLGTGASVGQYGPLVHIGASLGSWLSRIAGAGRRVGNIGLGCGAAAAIAAAFNAPVAGLVFAHEVILRHYSLRAFAPITVSATLGYFVSSVLFQRPHLFRIEDAEVASPYEYLAFIGIGVSGAVLAMLFMRAVLYAGDLSQRLSLPGPLKTALAGLAVGLVALQLPDVLGIGKEVLRFAIIEDAFSATELAVILAAKLLLTALCLGFGFAGGVFSPALLIGILFGALAGSGAEWLFGEDHSHIVIYAVCGMVAVTSPVIGAPLTTILIVFELTRNYDVATAAMMSAAFASLVGLRIFGRSLFDAQLRSQGFDLSQGRDQAILAQRTMAELSSEDYTVVSQSSTLAQARDALLKDRRSTAYIVGGEGAYHGSISLNGILQLGASGDALTGAVAAHAQADTLVLSPRDTICEAMSSMQDFAGESIPLVEDGRLQGVVSESAIVKVYVQTLHDLRREENAAA